MVCQQFVRLGQVVEPDCTRQQQAAQPKHTGKKKKELGPTTDKQGNTPHNGQIDDVQIDISSDRSART